MKVKIDTKEKMHVITIEEEKLTENMTEELSGFLRKYLEDSISNLVINLKEVQEVEPGPAKALINEQGRFYESGHSMVTCELQPSVYDFLERTDLLDILNYTPTESEASDIVQMEEIERELLQ